MALLDVQGLKKSFGGLQAVQEVSFTIAAGEIVGVIGPNGSGKTTIFNVLTGIYESSGGRATIDDGRHSILGLKPHQVTALGIADRFGHIVYTGALGGRAYSKPHPLSYEQMEAMLDSLYTQYVEALSESRHKTQAEVRALIDARWPIESLADEDGAVARRWRYRDGKGELGLVASVTAPFCRGCDRARLSAEGRLYTCLFASQGEDLRALLRGGANDAVIAERLANVWGARDDRYSEVRTSNTPPGRKVEMSHIGG